MTTKDLVIGTFVALGLFIAMGLMSLSASNAVPIFYECGVTGGC